MRAAIYIRVSTDEQAAEGFSLSAQEERCRNFIQSQGWQIIKEPYIDDGYSAKDLERPAIQQMIQDLKNNEFDVIVVYRLDRLVRSVLDLHQLLQLFDKHQVAFKSVTEVFDTTTAMGRFFITLVAAMAQWERENLAERVMMGMERRVLEGKRNGGNAPYGYRIDDNGKLVIHPEESKIVKKIFQLYMSHGTWTISKMLNERGIKTRNGAPWSLFTVRYILSNPVYTGHIRWKHSTVSSGKKRKQEAHKVMTVEADHEPIISIELFEEAQRKREQRSQGRAKSFTSDYPFSGILTCWKCGRPMVGQNKPRKNISYFYICSGKEMCDAAAVSERSIEEALFNITEWVIDTSFEPPEDKNESEIESIREQIEKEIESIRKRRRKWLLQFGDTDDEAMAREINDLITEDRKREEELLQQLEELPAEETQAQLSKDEFINMLGDIKRLWAHAERRERKELIHQIFKKIVVQPDMDFEPKRGRPRPVKIVDFEIK